MKTLIINTAGSEDIVIGLNIDGKEIIKKQKLDITKAQATLPMIEDILEENNIELKDLNSIDVNVGPGSFTGIRVGFAIANALSFVFKIPVNGKISDFAQALH